MCLNDLLGHSSAVQEASIEDRAHYANNQVVMLELIHEKVELALNRGNLSNHYCYLVLFPLRIPTKYGYGIQKVHQTLKRLMSGLQR